jgi:ribosomal protein L7/L12
LETGLTDHEKNLVNAGQRVQAIKSFRERTGCGLYEARHSVMAFIFSNPVIQQDIRDKFQVIQEKLEEIRKNSDFPAMDTVNKKFKDFFRE